MRRFTIVLVTAALMIPSSSQASSGKEFVTSVIYGTLAGTLVGAATLAFTSNPGDNLGNVARGASYGMYAGILLGLYITYGVGGGQSTPPIDPDKPLPPAEPSIYEGNPPQTPQSQSPDSQIKNMQNNLYGLSFYPVVIGPSHRVGIGATLLSYHF